MSIGFILVDFLPRMGNVSAVSYVQTLQNLWHALRDKRPVKDTSFFNMIMHALTLHT
jgi:hypothetical protein